MKQELIIKKVESKLCEIHDKLMDRSTDMAEELHHKECKIKCCGSHKLQENERCKFCNMTEDEIDDHNLQWWHCVDYIEETDEDCSRYCTIEHFLEGWLNKQVIKN